MSRIETAAMYAALAVALSATAVVPLSAAKPKAARSALETHEVLRQSLPYRARGPAAGMSMRETRRMRATLTVPLPDLDPAAVTGDTYVGLRIGAFTFERALSIDRSWRPGKTRASFRVASTVPDHPGATIVRARWDRRVLRIAVVSTSEAPIAATQVDAPTGPVLAPIDGAARLGDQHVHLGGAASIKVTRTIVPILQTSVDLARVDVVGRASVFSEFSDVQAPVVAITSPANVSTVAAGTFVVEGTVRDDRSVASIEWWIDGGVHTAVPFAADPSTGFLDDLRGTFSFSAPATGGAHTLRVDVRDVAGNAGAAAIAFVVPVADGIDLRTSKWGAACRDALGRVQSWGYGVKSPTVVAGLVGVRAATGNLAVLDDGTATTLHGDPSGAPSPNVPYPIAGLTDVADIAQSSTSSASYALRSDGTVWAWGDNTRGQLGQGTTSTSEYPPVQVPGLPAIRAISAGAYHALALDQDGGVWTWGGYYAPTVPAGRNPYKLAGVADAVAVSASQFDGYATGAAVLADGTLWTWGDALSGQLGGAAFLRETQAFQVPGVSGATSVALGYNHVLVRLSDDTVIARGSPTTQVWGYWGELGTDTPHIEFAPVSGLWGVRQVSAGAHTSHVLLQNGTIRAWGQNTYGSLGDGSTMDSSSPVIVQLAQ